MCEETTQQEISMTLAGDTWPSCPRERCMGWRTAGMFGSVGTQRELSNRNRPMTRLICPRA